MARNVAEIEIVRKNSAVLTVPMVFRGLLPWTSRFDVRAPSAAAGRVEKASDRAERLDYPGAPFGMPVHDAAVEEIDAEGGQIGQNKWLGR